MPEKPRRPQTHADRDAEGLAARRERDALHALPFAVDDDLTGQHERGEIDGEELRRRRERRPTPERLARLEEQRDALAADVGELKAEIGSRFDRIDRNFETLHQSLTVQSNLVIRNDELVRGQVWPETQRQMVRGEELQRRVAATERVADGIDQVIDRLDKHAERLGDIEKEQELAAQRFELHDKRDQEIAQAVESVRSDISALKQARAVGDATAKVAKQIARRSWWFSAKGVSTVAAAIAAAVGVIAAAIHSGGCS